MGDIFCYPIFADTFADTFADANINLYVCACCCCCVVSHAHNSQKINGKTEDKKNLKIIRTTQHEKDFYRGEIFPTTCTTLYLIEFFAGCAGVQVKPVPMNFFDFLTHNTTRHRKVYKENMF